MCVPVGLNRPELIAVHVIVVLSDGPPEAQMRPFARNAKLELLMTVARTHERLSAPTPLKWLPTRIGRFTINSVKDVLLNCKVTSRGGGDWAG